MSGPCIFVVAATFGVLHNRQAANRCVLRADGLVATCHTPPTNLQIPSRLSRQGRQLADRVDHRGRREKSSPWKHLSLTRDGFHLL